MNYFIGQGAGIVKEFENRDDMFEFHKGMETIDKHFCKLYDREKNLIIDGWELMHSNYSDESKWRKW